MSFTKMNTCSNNIEQFNRDLLHTRTVTNIKQLYL